MSVSPHNLHLEAEMTQNNEQINHSSQNNEKYNHFNYNQSATSHINGQLAYTSSAPVSGFDDIPKPLSTESSPKISFPRTSTLNQTHSFDESNNTAPNLINGSTSSLTINSSNFFQPKTSSSSDRNYINGNSLTCNKIYSDNPTMIFSQANSKSACIASPINDKPIQSNISSINENLCSISEASLKSRLLPSSEASLQINSVKLHEHHQPQIPEPLEEQLSTCNNLMDIPTQPISGTVTVGVKNSSSPTHMMMMGHSTSTAMGSCSPATSISLETVNQSSMKGLPAHSMIQPIIDKPSVAASSKSLVIDASSSFSTVPHSSLKSLAPTASLSVVDNLVPITTSPIMSMKAPTVSSMANSSTLSMNNHPTSFTKPEPTTTLIDPHIPAFKSLPISAASAPFSSTISDPPTAVIRDQSTPTMRGPSSMVGPPPPSNVRGTPSSIMSGPPIPASKMVPLPSSSMSGPSPPSSQSGPFPSSSMSGPFPPSSMSGPFPPSSMSAQFPPSSMSAQFPPSSMSAQFPPSSMSGPFPPSSMSGPLPPSSVSGPFPPPSMSGPLPPSSVSGPLPPSSVSGPLLPSSMNGPSPASNMRGPLPPSNVRGPLPPSSVRGPLPPANMSGPLPTTNMGGPLPTANMGGPLPTANMGGPLPPASMGGPLPPSNMSGPFQPSNMRGPLPPSSMSGPSPLSNMRGPLPPSSMRGPLPPSSKSGPLPLSRMSGPLPPSSMSGPLPPSSMRGPLPASSMSGPPRASTMMGPQPPSTTMGPQPPSAMLGPPPPSAMLGPPPPSAMLGPPPPSTMLGPPPPSTMIGLPPPSTMIGPPPPSSMIGPPPPSTMIGPPPPSTMMGPQPSSTMLGLQPPSAMMGPRSTSTIMGPQPPSTVMGPQPLSTMVGPPPSNMMGPPSVSSKRPQMDMIRPRANNRHFVGPPQPNLNELSQKLGGLSVTHDGWNKGWGTTTYDLLQQKIVIPPQGVIPPKPVLLQDYLPNCSPDIFRCTIAKVPESQSVLQKSRLPFGVLIHPFKDLEHLAVVSCSTIVRCRSCRTYINPFVVFKGERKWECNLCYRVNELPDEFQFDPLTRTYGDPSRRPEVREATIEFIAPQEYMLRPPQPATYVWVLDVSRQAIETGYLKIVCDQLLANLDKVPGDRRTLMAFITYSTNVQFYLMGEGQNSVQILEVGEIDDIFIPNPEDLLVHLDDSRSLIEELLTSLPETHADTIHTQTALGAALTAAHKLISHIGGRITTFAVTLPTIGPGALKSREDPNQRSAKDISNLGPSTDFYKKLALDCSGQQIAVDLFTLNSQYIDLATLSGVSKFSGGCIHHFPLFNTTKNKISVEPFKACLERYITRKIGFEAVMRIRTTRGLAITNFHGNFFVRSTDLLSLPNINPDAGFGMQITIEETLHNIRQACFQAALLYTSSRGERRIRVHTLCLPVSPNVHEIIGAGDQQAIADILGKMAVDKCLTSQMSDAREAIVNAGADILTAYKSSINSSPIGLPVPATLQIMPLYLLSLLKSVALRHGISTKLDDRVYAMCELKMLPLKSVLLTIYPDLYAIHNLNQIGAISIDDNIIPQPGRLHLSAEYIDRDGVYLMDAGSTIYVYVRSGVSPEWVNNALGVPSYAAIPQPLFEEPFPPLDNPISDLIRNFVSHLQRSKPYAAPVLVIKEDNPNRNAFIQNLMDDRSEGAHSYVEFLQFMKAQVK